MLLVLHLGEVEVFTELYGPFDAPGHRRLANHAPRDADGARLALGWSLALGEFGVEERDLLLLFHELLLIVRLLVLQLSYLLPLNFCSEHHVIALHKLSRNLLLQLLGRHGHLIELHLQLLVHPIGLLDLLFELLLVLSHSFRHALDLIEARLVLALQSFRIGLGILLVLLGLIQLFLHLLSQVLLLRQFINDLSLVLLLFFHLVEHLADVFLHLAQFGLQGRLVALEEFHGWISHDSHGHQGGKALLFTILHLVSILLRRINLLLQFDYFTGFAGELAA